MCCLRERVDIHHISLSASVLRRPAIAEEEEEEERERERDSTIRPEGRHRPLPPSLLLLSLSFSSGASCLESALGIPCGREALDVLCASERRNTERKPALGSFFAWREAEEQLGGRCAIEFPALFLSSNALPARPSCRPRFLSFRRSKETEGGRILAAGVENEAKGPESRR